jgi:hypothetical protein
MTQFEIDRAVAFSTGESIQEIRRRGFVVADQFEVITTRSRYRKSWTGMSWIPSGSVCSRN